MPPRKQHKPVYAVTEPVTQKSIMPPIFEPEPEINEPVFDKVDVVLDRPKTPTFDHAQPAGVEDSTYSKNLVQGVHRFTYAELDKQKGKYVPEPQYIKPGRIHKSELLQKLDRLNEALDKLPNMLLDLQGAINDNVDLLKEG